MLYRADPQTWIENQLVSSNSQLFTDFIHEIRQTIQILAIDHSQKLSLKIMDGPVGNDRFTRIMHKSFTHDIVSVPLKEGRDIPVDWVSEHGNNFYLLPDNGLAAQKAYRMYQHRRSPLQRGLNPRARNPMWGWQRIPCH